MGKRVQGQKVMKRNRGGGHIPPKGEGRARGYSDFTSLALRVHTIAEYMACFCHVYETRHHETVDGAVFLMRSNVKLMTMMT